ncbi:Ig-like domain-containing protein [Catonella massiliensis]|uniref:Ig-like domain-containing protein n=1 Tax=Catonella massiliensis TaxID=2799636 RepID=A0ABS1IXS8_9FIRM|nr:Ig-like domain-containing protein [Catonella massiliensis]MBK5896530.1 Ig-like domain-containing protein [Catonella massiliensis]
MKNFSKKLSFVMATAMVVTSLYAPQGAEAATTNKIVEKNSKSAVKRKNIYIGGQVVDFDAVVKGKVVKDSKGTWKSSDSKIASVDKNGKVKARKNGRVTISFKTKATKKTKSVTVKMTIDARTRASKMTLTPSAVVVKEGEKSTVGVNYEISKKIKAAGGKATTYKLFVESSDEKVAKAYVEGNNKIVVEGVAKSATPVSITVYSAQVYKLENAKKVKYKLTEKFDVKVNGKFDAKQVRANKISVVGTNLSTKAAAYVVKNTNGIVLNLKDNVEVNEAGTVATLESVVGQIPAGLYTVTFDKEDPVEFTAVKQVVEKIVIEPADKLILKGINDPDNKVAYAYYKVLDNFGENVTEQPLGANIYANGKPVTKKGEVEFTNNSAFILGSTFGLTLVDQNSGKTANAVLTVSRESVLSEASFKGVYDKKEKKFVKTLSERADLNDYVLLFEGKDQYGRTKNNADKLQVTIAGSTGLQVKTGKVDQIKVDGVEYMTFGLDRFTQGKLMAGEATVQAFSLESGKQSTPVKVNVVASTEVKTLSIGNGPKTIVAGEDAELSYSATDADGKPVTDFDILSRVTLNGGKEVNGKKGLRFEKKDGKVVLIYHPVADANIDRAVTEYVSYVTQTNNVGNAVLTVNPARVPTKIAGLKKDVATALTGKDGAGNTLTIKAGDIALKDQYGDDLDVKKALGTDYDILVKLEEGKKNNGFSDYGTNANGTYVASFGAISGSNVALTGDPNLVTATVTNPAISASFGVELSLLKKKSATEVVEVSGSKYSFRINAAPVKDLKNIKVEIPLAKAGSTAKIKVTATIDGKAVKLEANTDYQVIDNTVPATLPVGTTKGKANASIMLLDGSGKILTQEYEFSKDAPVLSSAEIKEGTNGELNHGAAIDATAVLAALDLEDQYGVTVTPTPTTAFLTFSNVKDGVAITSNGSSGAKIDTAEAAKLAVGDKIRIKVAFPGTSYVFEDDFVIK